MPAPLLLKSIKRVMWSPLLHLFNTALTAPNRTKQTKRERKKNRSEAQGLGKRADVLLSVGTIYTKQE